ncbi:aldo/keto reductase [Granulicella tundricola]|uniref:Aldo/keto reductase n=1 Tax=Granulicella tundricola (strain ATCC BAA-1859 / DSM 23138 / MP5ACTX9) TaxID=1198114 RepID=E8WY81_GRATM|nr:aldo/keto reductase [Granulicella tundricola]ADW68708.1 aldo/keto reductase [Granulicella tundricola MP5ACTX9]
MDTLIVPERTLNDALTLPEVGFGTYQLNGNEGVKTMVGAIRNGYRLLDSAFNYENEGAVGEAIRQAGIPRSELRVTSKLPGRHQKYREALRTVEESLFRAQLEYFDLYLIHWPNPKQGLYVEAWQALLEVKKRGLVRSVGVCNFLPEHLDRLEQETHVLPSVNQIEMHPYFSQPTQVAYDRAHGIATEAWSPLGRANDLLKNEVVTKIAAKLKRSPGQIVLRWHHQLGVIPIPKASSDERQRENLSLFDFELDVTAMDQIGSLNRPNGRLANQDPAEYEEF